MYLSTTHNSQPTTKSASISATLALLSLGVIVFGTVLGTQKAVRETTLRMLQATPRSTGQYPNIMVRYDDTRNKDYIDILSTKTETRNGKTYTIINLEGYFCAAVAMRTGCENWSVWWSTDEGGLQGVSNAYAGQFCANAEYPAPCERTIYNVGTGHPVGILKNGVAKNINSGYFNSRIEVEGTLSSERCPVLHFDSNRESARHVYHLSDLDPSLCGGTAPTKTPTNEPTLVPQGSCPFYALTTIKEKDASGNVSVMNLNKSDVLWYTMNDQQRAKHKPAYSPTTADENWYGLTNGKCIVDVPNVTWPMKGAGDANGKKYEYPKGSYACVKLYWDQTKYAIDSVDLDKPEYKLYLKDTTTKDEICGFLMDCNANFNYGWTMKKCGGDTGVPCPDSSPTTSPTASPTGTCPLTTSSCTPSSLTASSVVKSNGDDHSSKAVITWTPPSCDFTTQVIQVKDPNGTVVCKKTTNMKDVQETECDVREDTEGVASPIKDYVVGLTYTAEVLVKSSDNCVSSPGTATFVRHPKGADSGVRTHQIDVWETNGDKSDMCFLVADTQTGIKTAGGSHCRAERIPSSNGLTKLIVEYHNTTGTTKNLQWQLNSCNGKLMTDLPNNECTTFVSTNIHHETGDNPVVVPAGQKAVCTWDDPATRDRPTPDNCEVSGGYQTPTTPPSQPSSQPTQIPPPTSSPSKPTTAPSCNPNKVNKQGICDPACCKYDNECPSGQKCNIGNGNCNSGFSCNASPESKPTTTPAPPPVPPQSPDGRLLGTGPCAPSQLATYISEVDDTTKDKRSRDASCICQAESGSNPMAYAKANCFTGDYNQIAVGLFQVNIVFPDRCPSKDNGIAKTGEYTCKLVNQASLDQCISYYQNAHNNIIYSYGLSKGFSSWCGKVLQNGRCATWSTAGGCGLKGT